jgi:uncharacterized iron-regulated membrane protein
MTGRLLVFATGLACPVLFVTGVIRWLQKRRATRKKMPAIGAGIKGQKIDRRTSGIAVYKFNPRRILNFFD